MLDAFVRWLEHTGTQIFWTCSLLLVAIDVTAAAVVFQTRSREVVNRWTGRVLAINALLLGTGLGVPAAMYVTRVVVSAVALPRQGPTPQVPEAVIRDRAQK
jgi:hypothetical protein